MPIYLPSIKDTLKFDKDSWSGFLLIALINVQIIVREVLQKVIHSIGDTKFELK